MMRAAERRSRSGIAKCDLPVVDRVADSITVTLCTQTHSPQTRGLPGRVSAPHEQAPFCDRLNRAPVCGRKHEPISYSAFTAVNSLAIDSRASPNSSVVFGSKSSSFSIPANPGRIERFMNTT